MANKSAVAHFVFGFLLLLLATGVAAALDMAGIRMPWAVTAAELALVIPFALLVAARVGPLSVLGMAVAASAVVLGTQFLIVQIFDHLALPAGGSASWGDLYSHGRAPMLLRGAAITVLGSVAWLLLLRRTVRSMASNNSFKPKPLRGSA